MAVRAQAGITLYDITDGYSIILTSEAHTFVGGTSGAASGNSCETQVVAFCGSSQCSAVTIDVDAIVCPSGISAAVTNNGTASPIVKFTTTAEITAACEATIPVTVDGVVINKKFSFAVAKAGSEGTSVTIKSKSVTYQAGDSGTTAPTGTWSTSVPTVAQGKYLWTKTYIKFSDGTETTSYSVAYIAVDGAGGADGADAITLSYDASNGTAFKNNTGSTVLTAHVFLGGVEQSITDAGVCGDLGSIKWYKGDTLVATAKTYTVKASDVDSVQAYTCKLED